jgi:hypothetical protein
MITQDLLRDLGGIAVADGLGVRVRPVPPVAAI